MYIDIYNDNPTAGKTDGKKVSMEQDAANPVVITVNATKNETRAIKLALRCDEGYTANNVNVFAMFYDGSYHEEGGSVNRWSFAVGDFADEIEALEQGNWQTHLSVANVGNDNVIFWAKATSSDDESPANDTTVQLRVEAVVTAL